MSVKINRRIYSQDEVGNFTGLFSEGNDVKITFINKTIYKGMIKAIFEDDILLKTEDDCLYIDINDILKVEHVKY